MGKLPAASDSTKSDKSVPSESATLMLIATMADMTWRMFVPTIGLLLVGNMLDDRWHTSPWLMLVGALIGAAIATLLIRAQLRRKAV